MLLSLASSMRVCKIINIFKYNTHFKIKKRFRLLSKIIKRNIQDSMCSLALTANMAYCGNTELI